MLVNVMCVTGTQSRGPALIAAEVYSAAAGNAVRHLSSAAVDAGPLDQSQYTRHAVFGHAAFFMRVSNELKVLVNC